MALRADERRDKLRNAGGTRGTETSKYPKEEKETSIPEVAASETGRAQTRVRALWGSDRHNGYGR